MTQTERKDSQSLCPCPTRGSRRSAPSRQLTPAGTLALFHPTQTRRCRYRSEVVRLVSTLPPLLPHTGECVENAGSLPTQLFPSLKDKRVHFCLCFLIKFDDRKFACRAPDKRKTYKVSFAVFVFDNRNTENSYRPNANVRIGESRSKFWRVPYLFNGNN
jgi:hypothetical protein